MAARWALVKGLISHAEDAQDQNLPQMYWYAIEPLCAADKAKAIKLASASKIPVLRKYIARRIASAK